MPFSFDSQVGLNLKTPRYPIWLVCSESHFSVLFGLEEGVLTGQDRFDLYYYDGLANQQEEIRLTICTQDPVSALRLGFLSEKNIVNINMFY